MKFYLFIGALLVSISLGAQKYSTGTVQLSNAVGAEMSISITVDSVVHLQLVGPNNCWFSVGFNSFGMSDNPDVVIVKSNPISEFDSKVNGYISPTADLVQDWTILKDSVNGNQRIVYAKRALNTLDNGDYTFTAQAGTIPVIWACGQTSGNQISSHTMMDRGNGTLQFNEVLGISQKSAEKPIIYPNYFKSGESIHVSKTLSGKEYQLIDLKGKKIQTGTIDSEFLNIQSTLKTGKYFLNFPNENLNYSLEIY